MMSYNFSFLLLTMSEQVDKFFTSYTLSSCTTCEKEEQNVHKLNWTLFDVKNGNEKML